MSSKQYKSFKYLNLIQIETSTFKLNKNNEQYKAIQ